MFHEEGEGCIRPSLYRRKKNIHYRRRNKYKRFDYNVSVDGTYLQPFLSQG